MRRLILIGTVLFALLLTGVAHPDPERDSRIRQELRGTEVGDHTAFAMLVADFRNTQQTYPDFAWQIVKKEMHLDSEEAARDFLALMATAADQLDKAHNKAFLGFLCGQDSPRDQSDMRFALDTWDDLIQATDHHAYTRFISRLSDQQAQQLDGWLEEYKDGAVQIQLDHNEVFGPEEDVVGHVDMICARLRGG